MCVYVCKHGCTRPLWVICTYVCVYYCIKPMSLYGLMYMSPVVQHVLYTQQEWDFMYTIAYTYVCTWMCIYVYIICLLCTYFFYTHTYIVHSCIWGCDRWKCSSCAMRYIPIDILFFYVGKPSALRLHTSQGSHDQHSTTITTSQCSMWQ